VERTKSWYQSQHPSRRKVSPLRKAIPGRLDRSFPVAAALQHFPLKELQCISKGGVLEAGLFLGAPAPEAAQGAVGDAAGDCSSGESKEEGC